MPPLLNSLRDENAEVRRTAIIALGKFRGSTEAEDHLREFLADPDPATSMKAAVALAHLGTADDSIIPSLMTGLNDKDESTVRTASFALSKMAEQFPDKVAEAVGEALGKNQEPLFTNALKLVRIGKIQHDLVLSNLMIAYDKVPVKVRALMLSTIVETDPKGDKAFPMVAKALKDQDPAVRKEAIRATMRFGTKVDAFKSDLLAALNDSTPENRVLAVQAVRVFSARMPEAVSKLVVLADSPDSSVKTAALSALGSFNDGSKKVIRVLQKNATNENDAFRTASLTSLGDLAVKHSAVVTPILERVLKSEKDRKNKDIIVYSLHRVGKKTAYDAQSSLETDRPKGFRPGEELSGY